MKTRGMVYLGLGSNEGDREAALQYGLQEISRLPETKLEKVSEIISTKAEGFEGADFLNCCCSITTALEPQRLLEELKGIERRAGRLNEGIRLDENGRRIYSDRALDIDILLYGDEKINTDTLQVPHPRMLERDFVMIPLRQILEK